MPRDPKKSPRPRSPFNSLLDELMGSGVKYVVEAVKQAAPKCDFCGSPTILHCQACGRAVCNVHGFVNVQSVQEFQTVCSGCMSKAFDFVRVGSPPQNPEDGSDWPHEEAPWEILGVHAFSTEEEIEKAYRKAARVAHSDVGGSDEAMKKVNAARAYMMALRRKNKGRPATE